MQSKTLPTSTYCNHLNNPLFVLFHFIPFISILSKSTTLPTSSSPLFNTPKVQMNLQPSSTILLILTLAISTGLITFNGVLATTFTFTNKCTYTVWPGILPNFNSPKLTSTGFELSPSSSRSFQSPAGFSGRFWGRTDCNSDTDPTSLTPFYCSTGDCGSGEVECNEMGATPPVTLAEFTLAAVSGSNGLDFYDVSLVDGYNVPMIIEVTGGSGACGSTGCVADLNTNCPDELKAENGGACKSACMAFGSPEYCCSGAFNTPATCRPSVYSEMFKTACPKSYSYAYDDATSTFTCSGADYTITFCPSSPSQKSLTDTTPSVVTSPYKEEASAVGGSDGSAGGGGGSGVVADGSWLAGLAMGGTSSSSSSSLTKSIPTILSIHIILIGVSIVIFYV